MMRICLILVSWLWAASGALAETGPLPGRLTTIEVGPAPGPARTVVVWTPPDYDAHPERRYAVLYMHDGQNLFDPSRAYGGQTWGVAEALSRLEAEGAVEPTIVVGIDNTKERAREYMPAGIEAGLDPDSRGRLQRMIGGPAVSQAYLRYLVTQVKPAVDRAFRTRPDRDHTAVMGSSMGGLISLAAAAEYPDVLGAAGCISTHWPLPAFNPVSYEAAIPRDRATAAAVGYLDAHAAALKRVRLWFDHGDQTLDSTYAPYQAAVDAALVRQGLRPDIDFVSRSYPGAAHNEASWRARLEEPLRFLLSPRTITTTKGGGRP